MKCKHFSERLHARRSGTYKYMMMPRASRNTVQSITMSQLPRPSPTASLRPKFVGLLSGGLHNIMLKILITAEHLTRSTHCYTLVHKVTTAARTVWASLKSKCLELIKLWNKWSWLKTVTTSITVLRAYPAGLVRCSKSDWQNFWFSALSPGCLARCWTKFPVQALSKAETTQTAHGTVVAHCLCMYCDFRRVVQESVGIVNHDLLYSASSD